MVHLFRYVLVSVAILLTTLSSDSLRAQGRQEAAVRTAGTTVNLFETLDPTRDLDGLRVRLPKKWSFEEARLLRFGTEPVPVRVQRTDDPRTYLLVARASFRDPHDLVLRVRLPERPDTYDWALHTLVQASSNAESTGRRRFRTVERRTRRVNVEAPPSPDRTNQALSLKEASGPLRLRADALPPLGRSSAFTIEFWLKTNGLDEILLSTWNGNESVSYPAEFVVDRGGRLRFYTGRPGQHRALQSGRPIANGGWHHVAAVYDDRRTRLRLLLDGTAVDSLRGRGPPPAPGPIPMAVGGRLDREERASEQRRSLFSGRLDELRIWGVARSDATIRRLRSRPFRPRDEEKQKEEFVRLGFDAETDEASPAVRTPWPKGARRVPTTLSFQSGLQDLRAETDGRSVTLRWTRRLPSNVELFIVERSTKEQPFTTVAELRPAEAKQTTVSGPPAFRYTDEAVPGQVVFYRIRLRQTNGLERTSGTIKIGLGSESEEDVPVKLVGNFPNPFSETTTVAYEVNEPKRVTITVWNLAGHRIAQLADGTRDPGYHEISFDANELPSGTYFVRLNTPDASQSHRMVVLK